MKYKTKFKLLTWSDNTLKEKLSTALIHCTNLFVCFVFRFRNKRKIRAERMKGYEPAFLPCHQIQIHVQEAKNEVIFQSKIKLNTVNFRFIKHRLEIKQRA